ncbi:fused MFS/spermidine synthase [Alkalimonas collagenimarina]|uniref:Fused MFS/spermidine synthase n=1 Tax=Alkalimonas collagenimarina TaxID=400390 RepID=A0ABT9GUZ3_9GAMM|nr:fused MFS/spermidine synthase [Alkalimonas collagenimarina]MDP4534877.1 fused MFS/spermidine synthase [Alkalimonas collagenimarina]
MPIFILTIFLSAVLLFLIQPMMAKILLPHFGGGAAIWTACMLFFQAMLLAGYSYAHALTSFCSLRQQRWLHAGLIVVSLLWLVANRLGGAVPSTGEFPLLGILCWLLLSVGLPFLVVSATGPLLQRWFADRFPLRSPYRLYALSNVGSLGGLLSYPFLVEPWLSLTQQTLMWSAGFVLLAAFLLLLIGTQLPAERTTTTDASAQGATTERTAPRLWGYWLALSACGVVLLLAVTQQLTQNVPPVPFLWVVPLALYLLSYIVVFNRDSWYQRAIWLYLFSIGVVIALILMHFGRLFDLYSQLILYLMILFSGCVVCHGELAKLKPKAQQLTQFYLAMASGGVLGGVLVNLVAPVLLNDFYEFPLVLAAILLLAVLPWRKQLVYWKQGLWLAGVFAFGISAVALQWLFSQHDLHQQRNFYGSLSVRDMSIAGQMQRQLIDGTTSHGAQYLSAEKQQTALSYYREGTGVAVALQNFVPSSSERSIEQVHQRHYGMVGLGAGTLAVYGRSGDRIVFYELNPAVIEVADDYFSYLSESQADIEVLLGDARRVLQQQLEQSGSQQFDVLVLDAFTSDAIPQHLLTREAFELYWQHLMPDGILAVHVSNNYLDLTSVVRNHAKAMGLESFFIYTEPDDNNFAAVEWILLTNNHRFMRQIVLFQATTSWPSELNPAIQWTDDYSNLLQVLK